MAFLKEIQAEVLARQAAKDYKTQEYSEDLDDNFYVPQYRGDHGVASLPTNGSGYSQAIRQGDTWLITANITIGAVSLVIGDWLVSKIDGPSTIADFTVKSSESGVSSGSITSIADGATGSVVIGTTSDKNIQVSIVLERNSLAYSQALDFLYDGTNLHLAQGNINPYISANPTLGFVVGDNINGSNLELTYDNTAGLGTSNLHYKITKIL